MLAVFLRTEMKDVLSLYTVQRICSLLCINIVLIHATKAITRIIGIESYSRLKKKITLAAREIEKFTAVCPEATYVFYMRSLCFLIPQRSRYIDWLRAGRPRGRSSSPGGRKNFHSSMSSRQALGPTQPPIKWMPVALSPEVKLSRREADHSPPTSADVKKTWVCTSTPPYAFMA
jgi:hypothetical protein